MNSANSPAEVRRPLCLSSWEAVRPNGDTNTEPHHTVPFHIHANGRNCSASLFFTNTWQNLLHASLPVRRSSLTPTLKCCLSSYKGLLSCSPHQKLLMPLDASNPAVRWHVHPFQVTVAGRYRRNSAEAIQEKCLLNALRADVAPTKRSSFPVSLPFTNARTTSRSTALLHHCWYLGDKGHRHDKNIG